MWRGQQMRKIPIEEHKSKLGPKWQTLWYELTNQ